MIALYLVILSFAHGLLRPATLELNSDGTLNSVNVAGVTVKVFKFATLLTTKSDLFGYSTATMSVPQTMHEAFDSPVVTQGLLNVTMLTVSLPAPMRFDGTSVLFVVDLDRNLDDKQYFFTALADDGTATGSLRTNASTLGPRSTPLFNLQPSSNGRAFLNVALRVLTVTFADLVSDPEIQFSRVEMAPNGESLLDTFAVGLLEIDMCDGSVAGDPLACLIKETKETFAATTTTAVATTIVIVTTSTTSATTTSSTQASTTATATSTRSFTSTSASATWIDTETSTTASTVDNATMTTETRSSSAT